MDSANYIENVKHVLRKKIDVEEDLLDLYALLVLVKAHGVTWQDVHDAWSVWRTKTDSQHKSIVPFEALSEEVQRMDKEYADAIKETAEELNIKNEF